MFLQSIPDEPQIVGHTASGRANTNSTIDIIKLPAFLFYKNNFIRTLEPCLHQLTQLLVKPASKSLLSKDNLRTFQAENTVDKYLRTATFKANLLVFIKKSVPWDRH